MKHVVGGHAVQSTGIAADTEQWLLDVLLADIDQQDMEYADTFYFGRALDFEGRQAWLDSGCCGVYERQVLAPDGRRYIIACRYGH